MGFSVWHTLCLTRPLCLEPERFTGRPGPFSLLLRWAG